MSNYLAQRLTPGYASHRPAPARAMTTAPAKAPYQARAAVGKLAHGSAHPGKNLGKFLHPKGGK